MQDIFGGAASTASGAIRFGGGAGPAAGAFRSSASPGPLIIGEWSIAVNHDHAIDLDDAKQWVDTCTRSFLRCVVEKSL